MRRIIAALLLCTALWCCFPRSIRNSSQPKTKDEQNKHVQLQGVGPEALNTPHSSSGLESRVSRRPDTLIIFNMYHGGVMIRVLILCTHNSARSQMAEALTREAARQARLELDVHSAGTEATRVKEDAKTVMAELGLSLDSHTSKTLWDVPDARNFDYVITVCDSAAEACPVYPGQTKRRHYPFVDPSGGSLDRWRAVRDQQQVQFQAFVQALAGGQEPPESYTDSPPVSVA